MTSVAADGKTREMVFIDRRTFTMWLATIDTGRVKNERTRELVRTYQCEAADALDRYFNEGVAINPRAVGAPYDVETQARVLDILKNVISKDYLRETYAYTETDRPIFDRAWMGSYAGGFPEKRARKSKEKK